MLQTALEFLRKHNEITFATTDGTSPRLRIFQIVTLKVPESRASLRIKLPADSTANSRTQFYLGSI